MDQTRAFVKDVKRLIIKVGTAVVTRADGRLALGRLGALCEQVKELNLLGFEVILVTSGAVGAGRQRLRYRKLVNSSFADLQKPQLELDGKACAAVGQSGLMALYDVLFSQLDVTSSQLLVTDNDFKDSDFRMQLCQTVNTLLSLKVIPVFNENDAMSTRRAPYEDSSGIFWDNDSLAALLALELKADLLILLSDVEGLYSGPPSEPNSRLIHTYVKEKHHAEITFGDKSRVGRGGMTAKVKAAVYAACAGTPVVITSGFTTDSILKVLQGEKVGTLFHQDAINWERPREDSARDMAVSARECSRRLQSLSSDARKKILMDIADALEANEKLIRVENEADVVAAQQDGYEKSLISRLMLKPGKISSLANSVRALADMEDPIFCVLKRTEVADGLILEKTSCPLGVLLIVFESRPDALVQIASLAIRSGNGLLLKGGKEAMKSNAILHKVITEAIPDVVGEKLIGLITSREEIPDLLKLDDVIDLVIPRGSNKLVTQIKESTKIPVLGHSDGICHVYLDKSADMQMATRIVLDAKIDYPAACNAMETLLVHEDLLDNEGLNNLLIELKNEGVTLFGGPRASKQFGFPEAPSFHHEYNSTACTVEIIDSVHAAIDHIHRYGSAHTDCIIAEDNATAEIFLSQVDSAAVFHNASTRFCDGARFGLGAEVGISTSRIHARGPVGVEGLLTTRWILRGNGHVVDGDKGLVYTHLHLPLASEQRSG
ncbi:delta-1-pyrroline-5-carboxylate synthase 1-like isoform X2 [Zingiber officinale]|uniref:delta-1-pyrroline-5-carboxylate synthase 1-like isoform X2 n=1 Tax=Zingiber officinale TaxID=94328 RepID=UPI001C4C18DC|nr:delta-1-pyrroline-5-carboxylate synthase 1-like isoform X2 [Zingiber officinale]